MKRILCTFACCLSLFSPFALAEEQGVYFCTKDLDAMSSFSETNGNNIHEGNFIVYDDLNNPHNTKLRHCFMILATKIGEEHGNLYLSRDAAFGYGSVDYVLRAKAGVVYDEPYIPRATVSCVPVFEKGDLVEINNKDMFDVWLSVQRSMHDEQEKSEYNTIGHNCCTVAYQAVKDINGHLERIDATSFNLNGMGILWGQTLGTITSYVSSSSSSSPIIVRANRKLFDSSSEASKKISDLSGSLLKAPQDDTKKLSEKIEDLPNKKNADDIKNEL